MLDWQKYIEIADKFQHKARREDREDLRQDIILRFAELASNNGDKPLTEPAMLRIASYCVLEYWHNLKRSQIEVCLVSGIAKKPDYLKCSFSHKPDSCQKCCYHGMRPLTSLELELEDEDGNTVQLWQTIANDEAIDLEAWQDAKTWLLGCPKRLVQIAVKRYQGRPLDGKDQDFLNHYRRKELQKYQEKLAFF